MAHKEVFCYFSGDFLRDDVVERRHPKAGHHGPATLLRQQLMPDHFLGFERVLRLKCFFKNTYYYKYTHPECFSDNECGTNKVSVLKNSHLLTTSMW